MQIIRFDRPTFLARRWAYRAGEHVTFIGPTGQGKTTLAFQLLDVSATEKLPAVVLVEKPKDATVKKFAKDAGFRTVKAWPPLPSIWRPNNPRGWCLWPGHSYDPYIDRANHSVIFRRAILGCYKKGKRIIFADELYSLCEELDLTSELVTVWTKGRSMGCGLWGATQKPTHVPLWAYNQATHLFLSYDPDKRARDRFREISGMDPALIARGMDQLDEFEWLYIKRAGRSSTICIVEA